MASDGDLVRLLADDTCADKREAVAASRSYGSKLASLESPVSSLPCQTTLSVTPQ